MLKEIYAPTDFDSLDKDPSLSPREKLAIIANSPVLIHEGRHGLFKVDLPFVRGAQLSLPLKPMSESDFYILAWDIDVGDRDLYEHGIGSRLIQAAVNYGLERVPNLQRFYTGWARLGLVNTAIKVFGEENVAVRLIDRYGWNGDKPLEQLFDDHPPVKGKSFLVYEIDAKIDHEIALDWERPHVK